jgi:hypothetical protein
MVDNNDGFMELINEKVKEQADITPFEINNIKIVHHHFNMGDIDLGEPIETSLELISKYDFERQKVVWTKVISHTYYSQTGGNDNATDSFSFELNDCDLLISELEKLDLRHLRNNYFTAIKPEMFTHWEICYNNHFKVVGTYDKEIVELKKLSDLFDFKNVIREECKKINKKFNKPE